MSIRFLDLQGTKSLVKGIKNWGGKTFADLQRFNQLYAECLKTEGDPIRSTAYGDYKSVPYDFPLWFNARAALSNDNEPTGIMIEPGCNNDTPFIDIGCNSTRIDTCQIRILDGVNDDYKEAYSHILTQGSLTVGRSLDMEQLGTEESADKYIYHVVNLGGGFAYNKVTMGLDDTVEYPYGINSNEEISFNTDKNNAIDNLSCHTATSLQETGFYYEMLGNETYETKNQIIHVGYDIDNGSFGITTIIDGEVMGETYCYTANGDYFDLSTVQYSPISNNDIDTLFN